MIIELLVVIIIALAGLWYVIREVHP